MDHRILKKEAEEHEQKVIAGLGALDPSLVATDMEIAVRDGYKHPLRVLRPATAPAGGSPLVFCIHGGGFNSGTPYDVEPYARGLAKLFGAVLVAPTYRLAPEHPFPQGINDVWDAFKWTAANATELGATPSQGFILSGGSAGGNFVCVLAELAKSEKIEPPLTGIWNCVPVVFNEKLREKGRDEFDSVPEKYKEMASSWTQNAQGIIMRQSLADVFLDWYKPDWSSPLWSPFNAKGAFQGLPRTFIQVAGKDLIRDDGIIWARALADHGVETRLEVYPGVEHAFWMAFPELKHSRQFMTDIALGVGWLLGREVGFAEAEKAMQLPGTLPSGSV